MNKAQIEQRISEIESLMFQPTFWQDKEKAQNLIKELQDLKSAKDGVGKYDKGSAHLTVFAGAGGDDAEDFARILVEMYFKYCENKGWKILLLHENKNELNGYRNITFEIDGKGVYGNLKHESGVHRLVRLSPFNSKSLRHTSFAMAEVIPKFEKPTDFSIPEDDLEIEFTKSSGPGGQNVNKRETAVRVVHRPTGLSAFVDNERNQNQNKEKALEIIRGKVYNRQEEERKAKEEGMYISKTTDAEWGSQIRSYVLHPYKLVKDHRTDLEIRDVDKVLDGEIQEFIDAMKKKSN